MGKSRTVAMTLEAGASILVPTSSMDEISSKIVYQGPLEAPIASRRQYRRVDHSIPGMPQKSLKLVAAEPVAIGGVYFSYKNGRTRSSKKSWLGPSGRVNDTSEFCIF